METEDIVERCKSMSIKEDGAKTITIPLVWKEEGARLAARCLVGKLMTTKSINAAVFKARIPQFWRVSKKVIIESLGQQKFLFHFGLEADRRRVMVERPWHYDKALLILAEVECMEEVANQNFQMVAFWIQIYNVPFFCMHKEIPKMIGSEIGEVIEISINNEGRCLGKYLRIRILLDISKPVQKYVKVRLSDSKKTSVLPILYEKLPDFCFGCGIIGHGMRECAYKVSENDEDDLSFGAWMRATPHIAWSKPKHPLNPDHISPAWSRGSQSHSSSNSSVQSGKMSLMRDGSLRSSDKGRQVDDGVKALVGAEEQVNRGKSTRSSFAEPFAPDMEVCLSRLPADNSSCM